MLDRLRADIRAVRERDPAARNAAEILLLYSGLHAIMLHRPAYFLFRRRFFFLARLLSQLARWLTGVEIHPGAKIGVGVFIDHGSGIVIGETAEVGDGCTAKVLGPFTVGDNVKIAAGSVVLGPIPNNCTAVGAPARVVKRDGVRVGDLDQVHIPDPVAQELCSLRTELSRLQARVEGLERENRALRQEKGSKDEGGTPSES